MWSCCEAAGSLTARRRRRTLAEVVPVTIPSINAYDPVVFPKRGTMNEQRMVAMDNEPFGRFVLDMPDADVVSYPALFSSAEADTLFEALATRIEWARKSIRLYGRTVPIPRLTAWYGDAGATYTYSGITETPLPWTSELLDIRSRVESVAAFEFNSVLLNYYRGGRDSMSWHSDDEPELGRNPVIASVSFGAERKFQFKHRSVPEMRAAVDLTHGSLLLMTGPTQHFWKHQLPKSARAEGSRINLTFRRVGGAIHSALRSAGKPAAGLG